ncbi:MAG TPA: TonB-dependent receptor plug domain-containing protein [Longimicrobium sp.]
MVRSSHHALPVLALAALAAAACGPPPDPDTDPGPSMPPAASAAAPASTITAEDVKDLRVVRAEELLEGRFAGVEVLRLPTGGISVRIRGTTSVALSGEPLYVVDGIPINTEPGGALRWLNPGDVQKIEVLKDPGSTAFYGVRGANGVILITTKH